VKGELLVILVLNNVIVFLPSEGCQCKEGITFYYSVEDQILFLAKNGKMFINNAFPGDLYRKLLKCVHKSICILRVKNKNLERDEIQLDLLKS
jgi:hypothetical protein